MSRLAASALQAPTGTAPGASPLRLLDRPARRHAAAPGAAARGAAPAGAAARPAAAAAGHPALSRIDRLLWRLAAWAAAHPAQRQAGGWQRL